MSTHPRLLFLAAAGALAVPLLFTAATSAGDPGSPADTDTDAGPLDGGTETDADAAPAVLPSYRVEPFPEERSAEPTAREWTAAPRVALDRPSGAFGAADGPPNAACEARRVREWMRIRCHLITGAITLLGGEREGLSMRLDPFRKEEWSTFPEGAQLVFPVRRGDRREIEWLVIAFGYKGMNSVEPAFELSEQWAPGDERPMIVAR